MEQPELFPYTSAERRAWLNGWFEGHREALETTTPFAALCAYGLAGGFVGFLFGFFLAQWIYA